jgi:signal transduction histidine kinase
LLIVAWVVDLFTPQLLVAAILLNGPIALSSLALRSRLTAQLVVAAEIANLVAGYVNGLQAGYRWDGIAVGDRLLAAASFVLVGYLSVKTQQYAREAGVSAGRMRQVQIEKALGEATRGIRATLNADLVRRAILRESIALLDASGAILLVRDAAFELPLVMQLRANETDATIRRGAVGSELTSLAARARERPGVVRVTRDDPLGRLILDAIGAREALATAIQTPGSDAEYVLIVLADERGFSSDAVGAVQTFAEQSAVALDQARLFTQLGERNDEIARQKDELGRRSDVIRDIVYALAHDLRTPLVAAEVTMKQALDGAYGPLPDRYASILRTTVASNEEQRRLVETLLLVARYETGEESNLREPIACDRLLARAMDEMVPVAEANGATLRAEIEPGLRTAGDPNELRRAMLNLMANAIAATPEHGTIVVRARRSGSHVVVEVEDDGHGVPAERVATLFERFGGARTGGGTGLGLYIVRRIVQRHGGSVEYVPRQPRGSTFRIELPENAA